MTEIEANSTARPKKSRRILWFASASFVVVLAGGVALSGLFATGTSGKGEACTVGQDRIDELKPLATGEVAAFSVSSKRTGFPTLSFENSDGRLVGLEDFKGKTVLVNLWATWCVPCRLEMPALDKLQRELGGADFEVVAINVDTVVGDKPRKWLRDNGIENLSFYSDPKGNVLKILQKSGHVVGLPTTILLDNQGCQAGILKGGADWASVDAMKLIRAARETQ